MPDLHAAPVCPAIHVYGVRAGYLRSSIHAAIICHRSVGTPIKVDLDLSIDMNVATIAVRPCHHPTEKRIFLHFLAHLPGYPRSADPRGTR